MHESYILGIESREEGSCLQCFTVGLPGVKHADQASEPAKYLVLLPGNERTPQLWAPAIARVPQHFLHVLCIVSRYAKMMDHSLLKQSQAKAVPTDKSRREANTAERKGLLFSLPVPNYSARGYTFQHCGAYTRQWVVED